MINGTDDDRGAGGKAPRGSVLRKKQAVATPAKRQDTPKPPPKAGGFFSLLRSPLAAGYNVVRWPTRLRTAEGRSLVPPHLLVGAIVWN